MRRFLPLLAALPGCAAPPSGLEDVPVAAARLLDVSLVSLAVLGGGVTGEATLRIDTPTGEVVDTPVSLGGGTLGGILELSVVVDFGIPAELDLSDAPADLTGNDLLGTYDGTGAGAVIGLGVDTRTLTNHAGARIDRDWFAVGFALFGGFEWLSVRVDDDAPAEDSAAAGDTAAD